MNKITREIPNIISLGNAVSGFLAILLIAQGEYTTAVLFLCIAMVCDVADGFAARALKSYTLIGTQIDSLADIISFAVAPSFLLFHVLSGYENTPTFLVYFPSLLIAASTYRLARFNVAEPKKYFTGLATPANAFFIIALSFTIVEYLPQNTPLTLGSQLGIIAVIILQSFLLLCNIPMFSLKQSSKGARWALGLTIVVAIPLIISLNSLGLALSVWLYILSSLFFKKTILKYK